MRYRVRLINTKTGEKQLSLMGFTSKKSAIEWANKWKNLGKPFDCEIIDIKNKFKVIY